MKYSQLKDYFISKRLTSISCPFFGLSWESKDTERKIAREMICYLEDRRVLYGIQEIEVFSECVISLCKIRDYLTSLISRCKEGSELELSIRIMRNACRKFLNDSDKSQGRMPIQTLQYEFDRNKFFTLLGELRVAFGIQILRLSLEYELNIEEDLFSICKWLILEKEEN